MCTCWLAGFWSVPYETEQLFKDGHPARLINFCQAEGEGEAG